MPQSDAGPERELCEGEVRRRVPEGEQRNAERNWCGLCEDEESTDAGLEACPVVGDASAQVWAEKPRSRRDDGHAHEAFEIRLPEHPVVRMPHAEREAWTDRPTSERHATLDSDARAVHVDKPPGLGLDRLGQGQQDEEQGGEQAEADRTVHVRTSVSCGTRETGRTFTRRLGFVNARSGGLLS